MGLVSGSTPSVQSQSVVLSSAQLLALHTTPVALVAAPPALSYNVPVRVFYTYRFATTPYVTTDTTGSITFQGSAVVLFNISLVILNNTADRANYENEGQGEVFALTEALGKALTLFCPNANPTGGDGTLEIKTEYVTITP